MIEIEIRVSFFRGDGKTWRERKSEETNKERGNSVSLMFLPEIG